MDHVKFEILQNPAKTWIFQSEVQKRSQHRINIQVIGILRCIIPEECGLKSERFGEAKCLEVTSVWESEREHGF